MTSRFVTLPQWLIIVRKNSNTAVAGTTAWRWMSNRARQQDDYIQEIYNAPLYEYKKKKEIIPGYYDRIERRIVRLGYSTTVIILR